MRSGEALSLLKHRLFPWEFWVRWSSGYDEAYCTLAFYFASHHLVAKFEWRSNGVIDMFVIRF